MIRTETFIKRLLSYTSKSDFRSCLHACYCCLYCFDQTTQIKLSITFINRKIEAILLNNDVECIYDFHDSLSIDKYFSIRSTLIKVGFDGNLKLDGLHLVSSLDGLRDIHDYIGNHTKTTSSCAYSVYQIIAAAEASLLIKQDPSYYQKWVRGEKTAECDNKECVDLVREEWGFVAQCFLNNNLVSAFSDEDLLKMQRDFDIWEKQHQFLLS